MQNVNKRVTFDFGTCIRRCRWCCFSTLVGPLRVDRYKLLRVTWRSSRRKEHQRSVNPEHSQTSKRRVCFPRLDPHALSKGVCTSGANCDPKVVNTYIVYYIVRFPPKHASPVNTGHEEGPLLHGHRRPKPTTSACIQRTNPIPMCEAQTLHGMRRYGYLKVPTYSCPSPVVGNIYLSSDRDPNDAVVGTD